MELPALRYGRLLTRLDRMPMLKALVPLAAGIALADAWSSHSRLRGNGQVEADAFLGEDKEEIVAYCKRYLQRRHADYFIYGHRHCPIDLPLGGGSRYINTGDWITHFTYARFDGEDVRLLKYRPTE